MKLDRYFNKKKDNSHKMGAGASRGLRDANSIPEDLVHRIGCDTKGTVLCNSTELNCLNGGVCALFLSEVEDKCEQRCRCPPEYIGDYCQFYGGFYSATIGITIGVLLTVLFLVFIGVCIWYCCTRQKRKNQMVPVEDPPTSRVYLSNRIENPPPTTTVNNQTSNRNYLVQEPVRGDLNNQRVKENSTSRSYSVYDNVVWDEESADWYTGSQPAQRAVGSDGTRETAHLLKYDGVDCTGPKTMQSNQPQPNPRNTGEVNPYEALHTTT
ncbi:unnamed protein product [Calicophoron daubneyi]|uniref:EGF-like domain-containing protein n=1 Tax=Calicophoron daubneyi TaxID=300641 RepID=A0AAV2TRW8_CALDB